MSELFRAEVVRPGRGKIEGPPLQLESTTPRILAIAALALFLLLAIAALLIPIPQKAALRGVVVPDQGLMRLTGTELGRVAEVFVAEGDVVAGGQRIARVELLRATAEGPPGTRIEAANQARTAAARAQAEAEARSRRAEAMEISSGLAGKARSLQQIDEQLRLARQREALAQATVTRAEELLDRGFLTRFELDNRRYALLSEQAAIAALTREAVEASAEIQSDRARLEGLEALDEAAAASDRAAAATLSIDVARSNQEAGYYLVAPQAGRVLILNYRPGEELRAGTPVALLEPNGARPTLEFYAAPRDAVRLKPGDRIRVRLDAFPRDRFKPLWGQIAAVSPTVRASDEIRAEGLEFAEPMVRVVVRLEPADGGASGAPLAVRPGMLAAGQVVLDRRSAFDRIFGRGRAGQ